VRPRLNPAGLAKTKAWEYVVRFVFGGVVTVLAGLAAKRWGPVIGGVFLAFPAILPASLTLVTQHDGRRRAIDDARGGRLGSVGLIGFAGVVWMTAMRWPPFAVLAAATIVWLVVDGVVWAICYGRKAQVS
jgi:hypothetical protein